MNKKIVFIGVGILALGGLTYWYFTKGSSNLGGLGDTSKSLDTQGIEEEIPTGTTPPTAMSPTTLTPRQTRRNCRIEAREKCGTGLGKGKPKCRRDSRRKCKSEGGYDDGMADFAFNGFDGAFEMI